MLITGDEVSVGRMLIEPANWLIERHLRQNAGVNVAQKIIAVFQIPSAISRAWCKAAVVVEWLMVRHEVWAAVFACVDDAALLAGRPPPILESEIPAARIPRPTDAPRRQGVADGRSVL